MHGTVHSRSLRLATVAVVLSALIALTFAAFLWLQDTLPRETVLQAELAFLDAIEAAYAALVAAVAIGAPVLVAFVARARRSGRHAPTAARAALLAGSLSFAIVAAEVGAWAAWRWSHRFSAVPVGGFFQDEPEALPSLSAAVPDEVSLPTEFKRRPASEPREILVVGESSAAGVPYNYWGSVTHIVTWQLERTIPGLRVRPHIQAASGHTLERQHQWLSRLDRRPDVVIVYCGHNEFSARFPWSREVDHYVDAKMLPWRSRAMRAFQAVSPVCWTIREAAVRCRIGIPPPTAGYRSLVDVPAYTLAEFEALAADFERRLDRIVSFAEQIGALPILVAPAAGDSGLEPNRSYLAPETTAAQRASFERAFLDLRAREEAEPQRCEAGYRRLLERHPGFAELHYRLARLLERREAWEDAYLHDLRARDFDGLPFRCPTRLQEVYRRVAAHHGCPLIDMQSYFHRIAPHGLLNDNLFHDGIHPSLRGQIALAQAILQALRERRAFGWPESVPAPQIDPAACVEYFALVPAAWRRIALWGVMFYDLMAPVRYDPTSRNQKSAAFSRAVERIEAGIAPENVGLVNIGVPEPVPLLPGEWSVEVSGRGTP